MANSVRRARREFDHFPANRRVPARRAATLISRSARTPAG